MSTFADPEERWLLIRPPQVLSAQVWSMIRGLWTFSRLITIIEQQGAPVPWRVRYLLIQDDRGYVYYCRPNMTPSQLRLIEQLLKEMP